MSAVVFVGPTIEVAAVQAILDCRCLPPVAQGDLHWAALQRPAAIGIIDGYFHGVPSVWHKEILWAMAEGIPVFGSASMGALRAAELHAFGMQGCGRIFADYRDGIIEDDDEVAVLHGPAEIGFKPLSEPQVNIRATLGAAVEQAVISEATAAGLQGAAKALFYGERSWANLLGSACPSSIPKDETDALGAWLDAGRVDLKRRDAEQMLETMRAHLQSGAPAPAVDYDFELTHMWNRMTRNWDSDAAGRDGSLEETLVLDELRLDPARFGAAMKNALMRALALAEADRRDLGCDRMALRQKLNDFRGQRGLFQRQTLDHWLDSMNLEADQLEALLEDETRIDTLLREVEGDLTGALLDGLKLEENYSRLLRRGQDKHRALVAAGATPNSGLMPLALLAWHFENRLGQAIPDDLDGHIADLGLSSKEDFYRILDREYLYCLNNQEDS